MDLTKDETDYLLRRIENDIMMWEHELRMHYTYKDTGVEVISPEGLERAQSSVKALQLLHRKFEALLNSMEGKR